MKGFSCSPGHAKSLSYLYLTFRSLCDPTTIDLPYETWASRIVPVAPHRYYAGMLRELAVQNLALIEDVRVELHPGFCAWTGETGAGKSLLLGALGLLLGDRGSADLIRTGADELRVTGRFELSRPEQRELAAAILQSPLDE